MDLLSRTVMSEFRLTSGQVACPLWSNWHNNNNEYCNEVRTTDEGLVVVTDCVRSGGAYRVSSELVPRIQSLDEPEYERYAARMVSSLIEQRILGIDMPTISEQLVNEVKDLPNLSVDIRALRLLYFFAQVTPIVGNPVRLVTSETGNARAYAWSESSSWVELRFLCHYLEDQKYIKLSTGVNYLRAIVTVDGYQRIAKDSTAKNRSQAFVAMWLDKSMDTIYEMGIKVGLLEAGYSPIRIDRKLDVGKIDDAIIREIRRSRLLVADMTHGDAGVRGSVYYEAGFAHGLGLPVIYSCRSDQIELLHFDTRQYYHIPWSKPQELSVQLTDRVVAVVGQGPLIAGDEED